MSEIEALKNNDIEEWRKVTIEGLKAIVECAKHSEEVDTILYEADYQVVKTAYDILSCIEIKGGRRRKR